MGFFHRREAGEQRGENPMAIDIWAQRLIGDARRYLQTVARRQSKGNGGSAKLNDSWCETSHRDHKCAVGPRSVGRFGMGGRGVRRLAALTTTLGVAAAIPASALALSGPYTIGSGNFPAIAVDGAGTAYVVWQGYDASNQPDGQVLYCMIPDGATACAHTGVLATGAGSTNFAPGAATPRVVISGGTVAVLAHTGSAGDNSPIQEWQAPDGTANFALVHGGDSVADAHVPVPGQPGWSW